jgi:acyl carrier protein
MTLARGRDRIGVSMEVNTYSRVFEMIAEKAEVPVADLDPDRTLEDIGLDSLHLMEISLLMEKEYDIFIAEGDIHDDLTIGEVLAYLAMKIKTST